MDNCDFLTYIVDLFLQDILQIIISQLTLKDAARMSTLSRMWKMLWISHSKLSFDSAMVTNSDPKGDEESRSRHEKHAWSSLLIPAMPCCKITVVQTWSSLR